MSVYDKSSRGWDEADDPRTTEILRFVNRVTEGKVVSIARERHPQDLHGPRRYQALMTLGRGYCTTMWGSTEAECADEVLRWLAAQVEESLARVSGVGGFLRSRAHQALMDGLRRVLPPHPVPDPRDSSRLMPGEHLPLRLAPWTTAGVEPRDRKRYLTALRDEVRAFARRVGVALPGDSSPDPDPLDPLP
jgi:hypothetical protein